MDDIILEVNGLSKNFPIRKGIFSRTVGYVRAVSDVSFSMRRGEIFGLVGESGCGKSTTGRTILNLLTPSAGSVVFNGHELFNVERKRRIDPTEMRGLRKEMQIIFQDPYASLDPRMNVGAIISEGMVKHGMYRRAEALERAKELLELCEMPAASIHKYPHEFSGGQRQRIGIARALALEPSFIVGDEPIAALDVSVQAQVLMLLQDLIAKLSLTTRFISHDLGVVRYFCDRIGVMYLGSFVEMADSEALFARPAHPYTQALLSSMPKNTPDEQKQKIILEGDVPSPANPPSGCRFHTRCRCRQEICSQQTPLLREIEPGHCVACHLA